MGDYMMVTRVQKCGELPKLVGTAMRPWRVMLADEQHVYGVGGIVTGQRKDDHVARKSPHADSSLVVPQEVEDVLTALKSRTKGTST